MESKKTSAYKRKIREALQQVNKKDKETEDIKDKYFKRLLKETGGDVSAVNSYAANESTFMDTAELFASPELKPYSVRNAIREMEQFIKKYDSVDDLKEIIGAMRKVLADKDEILNKNPMRSKSK